jgi:hypothetical protein
MFVARPKMALWSIANSAIALHWDREDLGFRLSTNHISEPVLDPLLFGFRREIGLPAEIQSWKSRWGQIDVRTIADSMKMSKYLE